MVTLKEKKSLEQSLQRPLASSCCECCDQNDAKLAVFILRGKDEVNVM